MNKSRKKRTWPWALLILSVASPFFLLWRGEATTTGVDVNTAVAKRNTLSRTIVATGVIRPVVGAEVNVGCRVSGKVVRLPVKVGDEVRAGDLLAQLETKELDALVEQAKAQLSLAEAELSQSQSTLRRRRNLAEEGILAAEDLDLVVRNVDVKRALKLNAEARLRVTEINLGYARIEAPIKGVIADVTTRQGETVAASFAAPTFVTIIDLSRLEVRAFVDETDIGRAFVGQKAVFTVDTHPDMEFAATVTAIEPKAEIQNSVVNYIAVLEFENDPIVMIRPEMTAHVRLEVEQRENALTVPRNAIRHRDGRTYVMVSRGEEWEEQEVKVGWRTDSATEILDGLSEGDSVQINNA